jgi:hypothetical protein
MVKNIEFSEALQLLALSNNNSIVASAFSHSAVNYVNLATREVLGRTSTIEVGMRIISTSTLYWAPVNNGDIFYVKKLGTIKHININLPGNSTQTRLEIQKVELENFFTNQVIQVEILLDHFFSEKPGICDEWKRALFVAGKMQDEGTEIQPWMNPIASPGLFRFADCVTGHKLQGSEWDDVILLTKSLQRLKATDLGKAWAYTVITRARKNLYICEVPWG